MPRSPNNLRPKVNVSEEKLRATPFSSVAELDAEAKAIRLSVWRSFTEAQVIHELLTKPENAFVHEEWRRGLQATFDSRDAATRMYRIFSEGKGLTLEINKEFTMALGEQEVKFFEGVVRAGIEGFGALYLRSKGLITQFERSSGDAKPSPATGRRAKEKKSGKAPR